MDVMMREIKNRKNKIRGNLYVYLKRQWILVAINIVKEDTEKYIEKITGKWYGKHFFETDGEFFIKTIMQYIVKYYDVLLMKWKQTHFKDDYGKIIIKDWDKELQYFLINIVSFDNNKSSSILGNILNKHFPYYKYYDEKFRHTFLKLVDKLYNEVAREMEKQNNGMPIIKTGVDYENYVETLLQSGGFEVSRTPTTGDQGVDLVAVKNNIRIAIQCKYYSKPVGNKAVQEVIAGRDFYNCQIACVVSNNTFTLSARKIANVANVLLLNENQIVAKLDEIVG